MSSPIFPCSNSTYYSMYKAKGYINFFHLLHFTCLGDCYCFLLHYLPFTPDIICSFNPTIWIFEISDHSKFLSSGVCPFVHHSSPCTADWQVWYRAWIELCKSDSFTCLSSLCLLVYPCKEEEHGTTDWNYWFMFTWRSTVIFCSFELPGLCLVFVQMISSCLGVLSSTSTRQITHWPPACQNCFAFKGCPAVKILAVPSGFLSSV